MTPAEQHVRRALSTDGWQLLHTGWPDFLLVRGKEIAAVEVKTGSDHVRSNQLQVLRALKAAGIPVFVVRIASGKTRTRKDSPKPDVSAFTQVASYLGRLGGTTRAARLSPRERSESAIKAARSRWSRVPPEQRRDMARKAVQARWMKSLSNTTTPHEEEAPCHRLRTQSPPA